MFIFLDKKSYEDFRKASDQMTYLHKDLIENKKCRLNLFNTLLKNIKFLNNSDRYIEVNNIESNYNPRLKFVQYSKPSKGYETFDYNTGNFEISNKKDTLEIIIEVDGFRYYITEDYLDVRNNSWVFKKIPEYLDIPDLEEDILKLINENVPISNTHLSGALDFWKPNLKFISYNGRAPNLCNGELLMELNEQIIRFPEHCLKSGGSCSYSYSENEKIITEGTWSITKFPYNFSNELKEEAIKLVNENIPWGCCGGCIS